jgi:primary-amine oxidase
VIEIEDNGITPIPVQPANYRHGNDRCAARKPEAANHCSATRGPASRSKVTRCVGKTGISASGSPRGKVWCSIRLLTKINTIRSVLYRASLAEMVVPYDDPSVNHFRKNAFDAGEYSLGMDSWSRPKFMLRLINTYLTSVFT